MCFILFFYVLEHLQHCHTGCMNKASLLYVFFVVSATHFPHVGKIVATLL